MKTVYCTSGSMAKTLKKQGFAVVSSAEQVGAHLRQQGLPVLSTSEIDDCECVDGEVNVTDTVHVQVGWDYLIVGRSVGEGESFGIVSGLSRTELDEVVADIKKAMEEESRARG